MKDPEEALRTAYNVAFTGKIGLKGVVVPVYVAAVPSTESAPYICISEVTVSASDIIQGCTNYDCTVLVDVVTEYDNNKITPSDASRIGAAVMKLSENIDITLDGNWKVAKHQLELSQSLLEENEAKIVHRRLIRFRNRLLHTGIAGDRLDYLKAILLEDSGLLKQQ